MLHGTSWRAVALPTATLVMLVVVDIVTPGTDLVFTPLFALAPLAACAVLPARTTAVFALAAVVAALGAGQWNGDAGTSQYLVRMLDVILVSAAAVVVAGVRVWREEQVHTLTEVAEVAQRAILPVLPAHARRTDIAARYQSATQDTVIGGDLYDCYHSRSHTRFLLGDVRGKGIDAVEQAARVIRAFRQAAAVQSDLGEVAQDIHTYLVPFFDDEEFVTAVFLDTTEAERPILLNAGHPPPLLVRADGTCEFVESEPHLPLGIGDDYRAETFSWNPGDRLLLYTDGVSEARDRQGEFLDLHLLGPLLVGVPVEDALDRLLEVVRSHAYHGEFGDDVAVLLLEHTAAGQEYLPRQSEHDWRTSLPR